MTYMQILELVKAVGAPTATLIIGIWFIMQSRKDSKELLDRSLAAFQEAIETQAKDSGETKALVKRIDSKTDLILDNAANELDADNVINMGVNYLQKVHLQWISYYELRKRQNHILDQPDVISARYNEKIREFAPKLKSQFGRYTYKGRTIDHFWGKTGSEYYCRYLLNDLFALQYNVAAGQDSLIKEDELLPHFERVISSMIGMLRVWTESGKSFEEQWDNSLPKITLYPPKVSGTVEFLQNGEQ